MVAMVVLEATRGRNTRVSSEMYLFVGSQGGMGSIAIGDVGVVAVRSESSYSRPPAKFAKRDLQAPGGYRFQSDHGWRENELDHEIGHVRPAPDFCIRDRDH